ncbi:MAG: 4-hydroxy-tetrahydrodipicolinate reductase, partial [Methyloligellaceae bacterium]
MSDMKLAVMGAAGRMGRELIRAIDDTGGCTLAGGTEAPGSDAIGQDLGEFAGLGPRGVAVSDEPLELFTRVDG